MENKSNILFLSIALLFFTACGEGGKSSPSPIYSSVGTSSSIRSTAVTSSSLSSSNVSAEPIDEQSFDVDEDGELKDRLSIKTYNNRSLSVFLRDEDVYGNESKTTHGGTVRLVYDFIEFSYVPPEDFNGDDEFVFYTQDPYIGGYQQHKVTVHVHAVADLKPKIKIEKMAYYPSGKVMTISPLYLPDTNEIIPTDKTTHIYLNDQPLSFQQVGDELQVNLPTVDRAGKFLFTFEQNIGNEWMKLSFPLGIKIEYEDVEFYLGDKGLPGQTVVLVRDGDVTAPQFASWINKSLAYTLDEPLIQQYKHYWSFAVLKAGASQILTQKGGDVLILPLDFFSYLDELIQVIVPNYTKSILLSGQNGRSTGGQPIVLSMDNDRGRVLLHELGHSHAKLGDEYVDSELAIYPYRGGYPNISVSNKYELLPWKHWIKDKNAIYGVDREPPTSLDVGAFLGAYYDANKNYRPTKNSLMRDHNADFGPVNKEAWVLANYEAMGILQSATIEKKDGLRTVTLSREWDKNLTRVDWYIDQVKQEQFSDQAIISIDETVLAKSSYTLSAQLSDLTGAVLNPDAYPEFNGYADSIKIEGTSNWIVNRNVINPTFKKEWNFSIASENISKKSANGRYHSHTSVGDATHWMGHRMQVHNGTHQVQSSFDYVAQDAVRPVTGFSIYRAVISSDDGAFYWEEGIDIQHADMPASSWLIRSASEEYKIVHPHIDGPYSIKIYAMPENRLEAEFFFPVNGRNVH